MTTQNHLRSCVTCEYKTKGTKLLLAHGHTTNSAKKGRRDVTGGKGHRFQERETAARVKKEVTYAKFERKATRTAPPKMLPKVTGSRLPKRNALTETDAAPACIPMGTRNMLATEWSKPMATKAEMGSSTARNLLPKPRADAASQIPRQTSQLQATPLAKAVANVIDVFAFAIPTTVATLAAESTPDTVIKYTTSSAPIKFPMKLAVQFRANPFMLARPDNTAAVTRAVFPVKSSPPAVSTMVSPNGKPTSPKSSFCSPGFAVASAGTAPPTVIASAAAMAMYAPARMPMIMTFSVGSSALAAPKVSATASAPAGVSIGGVDETATTRARDTRRAATGSGTLRRLPTAGVLTRRRKGAADTNAGDDMLPQSVLLRRGVPVYARVSLKSAEGLSRSTHPVVTFDPKGGAK